MYEQHVRMIPEFVTPDATVCDRPLFTFARRAFFCCRVTANPSLLLLFGITTREEHVRQFPRQHSLGMLIDDEAIID